MKMYKAIRGWDILFEWLSLNIWILANRIIQIYYYYYIFLLNHIQFFFIIFPSFFFFIVFWFHFHSIINKLLKAFNSFQIDIYSHEELNNLSILLYLFWHPASILYLLICGYFFVEAEENVCLGILTFTVILDIVTFK